MISYQAALKILLNNEPLEQTILPIEKALGYIGAKDIYSEVFVPPFNNSAMDGFAVKSADIANASKQNPIALKFAGSTMAGDRPSNAKGGAWEIMTGAPVPKNYDSVVKIEDVEVKNQDVIFSAPVKIHNNIRDAGEDFKPNDLVLEKGSQINSMHIMALATIGQQNIAIYNKPRISVFSTGKELVENSDKPLLEGQIRNSNSPYLISALKEMNIEANYGGIIDDRPEIFEEKIRQALPNNDVIISTGAVSMGKLDFIPDSLTKLGAKILFHKVFIRPGKPILYARFENGAHYFGLPGNPVSAAVGLRFFAIPLLRHLQGMKAEKPLTAPLLEPYPKKAGFRFFLKAKAFISESGQINATILNGQQSFKIHPLLNANCWISIAANNTGMDLSKTIQIYPLTPKKWDL